MQVAVVPLQVRQVESQGRQVVPKRVIFYGQEMQVVVVPLQVRQVESQGRQVKMDVSGLVTEISAGQVT